jgi:hypothetical protein
MACHATSMSRAVDDLGLGGDAPGLAADSRVA